MKVKSVKITAVVIAVIFIVSTFCSPVLAYDKSYTSYVSGHGHIDTAWQWNYATTISDLVYNTWLKQVNLMEANPDYKFSASAAQHYAWMKEYYPTLYNQIKAKISSGQWDFVGGEWVEADTNVPSGESMVRQFLKGQTFFKQEFGKVADVAFLPDDPGHSWILPQIALKSGAKAFTATRISALPNETDFTTWGMSGYDNFNWKGVDGTVIPSYKPTPFYTNDMSANMVNKSLDSGSQELGFKKGFFYGGDGDMGGGPTQAQIDSIHAVNDDPDGPATRFSKMIDYFDSLTEEEKSKIPEFNDELYYNHELGLYTTHGDLKKYNNDNEVTAEAAEKLDSIAMWLGAASYPADKLDKAWKKILNMQFHDVLPGCSIDSVIQDAWSDSEVAANLMKNGEEYSMAAIASRADTTGTGVPIIIFNSLSYERTDVVETSVTFESEPDAVKIYDPDGTEIPSQATIDGNTARMIFVAKDIPSIGYAVYRAEAAGSAGVYDTGLSIGGNTIENDRYIVELNASTGNVRRIYDKQNGREILQSGKEIELQKLVDTPNGGWNAWVFDYDDQCATPSIINGSPTINLVEAGPVRATYEVTKTNGSSTYKQKISLYSDVDRVDFPMNVDWHETDKMIKAAFPLAVSNPNATFDLSYGTVERGNRNPDKREVPAQKWADITDTSGDFGVSILSECKYGWDKVDNNTLRLSLLRSAKDMDSDADMGVHDFTFSIYSHAGSWADGNSPREANSMAKPFIVYQDRTAPHGGTLGKTFSFVSVDKPNIEVTAVKKAEDPNSNDLIFRLYESQGKASTSVNVTLAGNITALNETNLIEENTGSQAHSGNSFSTSLHKYELKTFRVSMDNLGYSDTKPAVTRVDLSAEYNQDGMSHDSNRTDGDLDMGGHTLSADQLPDEVVSEDIGFDIGPRQDGQNNVVKAEGQTIQIDPGANPNNTLYILGTSVKGPQYGDFIVKYSDDSTTGKTLKFNDWTAMIGGFGLPGITDNIGYVVSHRHNQWGDDFNRETYLYVYKIALDPAKTVNSITLPDNQGIKILGMSLASGGFLPAEANELIPFTNDNTTVINDDSPFITYGGSWTDQNGRNAGNIGGDVHYSADVSNARPTVEFSFIGTGVDFITEKGGNQGNVEVYIDDVLTDTVDTAAPAGAEVYAAEVFSIKDLPLETHRIKLVGVSGYWMIFDAFRVTDYTPLPYEYPAPEESTSMVNDDAPAIKYTGNWTDSNTRKGGDYKSDIHYTETIDDYAEFTFSGTVIDFVSEKDPEMGLIDVYIDGGKDATVNCAASKLSFYQTVYYKRGLAPGTHTVKVVLKSGTKLTVDGFQVTNYPAAPGNASIINNNNSSVKYTGNWSYSGSRNMGDYMDDVTFTSSKGSYCEYTFTGTGIYFFTELDNNLSDADVYIDGVKDSVIHMAAPSRSSFYQVYGRGGLPFGTHTVKIVNALSDRYLIIDAFKVSTNTTGSLAGAVNNPQGVPLAGVNVTLAAGGQNHTVTTDGTGMYTFTGIAAGTGYVLTSHKDGYQNAVINGISIISDGTLVNDAVILDPLAPANAAVVNDDDASMVYSGSWGYSGSRSNGDHMADVHYTTQIGASCTYTFTGTGIYFHTELDNGLSDADIYIDDVKVRTVHLAAGSSSAFNQVFGQNGLPYGQHTIKVVNAIDGRYLIVDAFKVSANTTGTVSGVVRSLQGNPLEGASVKVTMGGAEYTAVTDVSGKYTAENIPAGTGYTVTVSKAGYQEATVSGINVISDSTAETGEILLEEIPLPDAGKLTGRIVDISGSGIPDVMVSLNAGGTEYTSLTNASGYYTVVNIPAGSGYTLTAAKAGYKTESVSAADVTAGNTTVINNVTLLEIAHIGTITGRVIDSSGRAVKGAAVNIENTAYTALTDSAGNYSFIDIPSGNNYTLTAAKQGFQPWALSQIEVTAGNTTAAPDITIDPLAPANASIVNNDSASVTYDSGWNYSGSRGNGDYMADIQFTTQAGASCTYTFTGTGIYFYTELDHGLSDADIYVDDVKVRTVHLAADTSSAFNQVFGQSGLPYGQHTIKVVNAINGRYLIVDAFKVSANTTGAVSGIVKSDSNQPVQGAVVNVTAGGISFTAATDASGSYTIDSVPAGTDYTMNVSKEGYMDGTAAGIDVISDLITSVDTVVLSAISQPGTGTISGRVLDSSGNAVEGAAVTVVNTTGSAITGPSGDFLLTNIGVGTGYTITVNKEGYNTVSVPGIDVTEGTMTLVNNIILTRNTTPGTETGIITGRVVDGAGNAISGANVTMVINNVSYTALTDIAGNYVLAGIPAGTGYTAIAYRPGYYTGSVTGINIAPDSTVTAPDIVLNRVASSSTSQDNTVQTPDVVVNADGSVTITGKPVLDKSTGTASVVLNSEVMEKASGLGAAGQDGIKTVKIDMTPANGAETYEVTVPVKYLTGLVRNQRLEIRTSAATLTVPGDMLQSTDVGGAENAVLTIAYADRSKLGEELGSLIGDRPAIELGIRINGNVLAWSNHNAPVSVSIPYTPGSGELRDSEHITVLYADGLGNPVPVTSGRYDAGTGTVRFNTVHFSTYAVAYIVKTFDDLAGYGWAEKQIGVLASKGIIGGTTATTFSPERQITRADYLTLLMSTLGLTEKCGTNFDDVEAGAYYYDAVGTAKKLGIISGAGNNQFNPKAYISRQDMMVLTEKALNLVKKLEAAGAAADLDQFADQSQISGYAASSVANFVKAGLIHGANGRINPRAGTTRAEAAALLYNIYNRVYTE